MSFRETPSKGPSDKMESQVDVVINAGSTTGKDATDFAVLDAQSRRSVSWLEHATAADASSTT